MKALTETPQLPWLESVNAAVANKLEYELRGHVAPLSKELTKELPEKAEVTKLYRAFQGAKEYWKAQTSPESQRQYLAITANMETCLDPDLSVSKSGNHQERMIYEHPAVAEQMSKQFERWQGSVGQLAEDFIAGKGKKRKTALLTKPSAPGIAEPPTYIPGQNPRLNARLWSSMATNTQVEEQGSRFSPSRLWAQVRGKVMKLF